MDFLDFIDTYIDNSTISRIIYDNNKKLWIVEYNYNVKTDSFESPEDLMNFIIND